MGGPSEGARMDPVVRGCTSKRVYDTRQDARRVAKAMTRRHHEHLRAYACRYCRSYHVGHIVPAAVRATLASAAV